MLEKMDQGVVQKGACSSLSSSCIAVQHVLEWGAFLKVMIESREVSSNWTTG